MPCEKQGFRDTIMQLNEMFPDKGMLTRSEVAAFIGVDRHALAKMNIRFNATTKRITKADLARQVCT